MTAEAAALYRTGVYGNTMTTNPRAMDVGVAVLESITPELRENIRERGAEFVEQARARSPPSWTARSRRVQGTGLLVSCELDPERYLSYGADSTEEYLRTSAASA